MNNYLDKDEYYWADRIFIFKYNAKNEYSFNLDLVRFLISEYLNSENSFEKYNRFSNSNMERDYGISVFGRVLEHIEYIKKGWFEGYIDIRIFRIIKEHKTLMLKRLDYINKNIIDIGELVEKYKEIFYLSEQCYHLALKYKLSLDKSIPDKLIAKIFGIVEGDQAILRKLLERLEHI
jgi:hypothetical protein